MNRLRTTIANALRFAGQKMLRMGYKALKAQERIRPETHSVEVEATRIVTVHASQVTGSIIASRIGSVSASTVKG